MNPDGVPVLRALRVDKVYPNGVRALSDVCLDVHAGEFTSLLGPSGCGKSTLLRLLSGLESPSSGQLHWWGTPLPPTAALPPGNGRPAGAGAPEGGRISMVFQEPTLMPWATVTDNVLLPFDLAGRRDAQALARVAAQLDLVGLSAFRNAYPRELSGGMQMRVAIARALVTEPDLLLMDEPFGALDEFTRQRLDDELRGLWTRRPLTVVFVTHSIYEAVFLSNRVIIMGTRPGRIVADLPIEGPRARDGEFRLSAQFLAHCRDATRCLADAHLEPEAALRHEGTESAVIQPGRTQYTGMAP